MQVVFCFEIHIRSGMQSKYHPRAKDLADSYMVTWMRVADVTVLSVGALTFSSDPRFSVIHVPRSVEDNNKNTITDGGSIAMHSKAISGLDWMDGRILLGKLVLLT